MSQDPNILEVRGLTTEFEVEGQWLRAVDGVSFSVPRGKTVGVVGESGCGKSVTCMSIIDLLPKPMGQIKAGEILFKGRDLRSIDHEAMCRIRGGEIGTIFQEPMTALNPVHRVGRQLTEVLLLHRELKPDEAWAQATEMLDHVGIPDPEQRMHEYPHQLSGGMRQRVMIAIALACKPDLLIADEPTTALDVTVQAQILDLLNALQKEMGMSIIMITHDLGVIAATCDEVVVMYAGRVVERGNVVDVFKRPRHAYTRALLDSMPSLERERKSLLPTIPGTVASITEFVSGCRFCQRMERPPEQLTQRPELVEAAPGHWVANCPHCTSAANNTSASNTSATSA